MSHWMDKDIRVKIGRKRQRQGKRSGHIGYRDPSFYFYFKGWHILQNK